MDDLTFRKAVYADPFTKDPAIIEAASLDPSKKAFWDDVKAMEGQLSAAMNVPIPENLAEKLILRQSLNEHKRASKRRPWYVALAASVLLASVLTVGILNTGHSKLKDDVFAHLGHINFELMKSKQVEANTLNDRLASFNGYIKGEIGEVLAANFCYLDKIKSLHIIVRGEHGLTSLFVVPDAISDSISERFSNTSLTGASFLLESAKVIIVGENQSDVATLEQKAKQTLSFSA